MMQIVINISEKDYEYYKDDSNFYGYSKARQIILDGTPLPKGHGRLIDADALEELCYEHEIGNDAFDGEPLIEQGQYDDGDNIWKPLFDFAPTLIEADNEKE